MNTHDKYELPTLPEPDQYTWYSRNLVESIRKRAIEFYQQGGNAKHQYEKAMAGSEELDPIERLRFFCSIALRTQDWLDAEPFFEDLVADRKRRGEPVAWYTDDHLTDKSATTWDRTVAARWRGKGWPVGELFAAPQPQQIPEGYKLVPIDPTQEMLFAGDTEFGKRKIPSISGICYKAMLEAAPEPANPGREVEK